MNIGVVDIGLLIIGITTLEPTRSYKIFTSSVSYTIINLIYCLLYYDDKSIVNKLTVLVEGYARENSDGSWNASPTTTLIESKGKKILVDPGANSKLLINKLSENNLKIDDIDLVFLSHYHPDHILNIRLFPEHEIYDGGTIYNSDLETFFENTIPDTDIRLLATPGHSSEHTSLIVDVDGEKYVIAQDVFWWVDGSQRSESVEELLELEDPFATDKEELIKSRKKIIDIADWIIPGHGRMFRNPNRR